MKTMQQEMEEFEVEMECNKEMIENELKPVTKKAKVFMLAQNIVVVDVDADSYLTAVSTAKSLRSLKLKECRVNCYDNAKRITFIF